VSQQAFLVAAARTPIGSFQGALRAMSAPALGAHAIRAATSAASDDPSRVDEVIMGNVVGA
jgi:acetyl-CoA C-acetyltransferase